MSIIYTHNHECSLLKNGHVSNVSYMCHDVRLIGPICIVCHVFFFLDLHTCVTKRVRFVTPNHSGTESGHSSLHNNASLSSTLCLRETFEEVTHLYIFHNQAHFTKMFFRDELPEKCV
jgi:hypothetical protein